MNEWMHLLGTVVGAAIGNLVMLPLVRRHLLNLHKRVGTIEKQLGVEPKTPPPDLDWGWREITNPGRKL